MRVIVVVAPIVLVATIAMTVYSSAKAEIQQSGQHWARTTQELRIGIEYGPGADPQVLANVAANWSHSPYVEMGVIGRVSDPAACINDQYYVYTRGVIVACVNPDI